MLFVITYLFFVKVYIFKVKFELIICIIILYLYS